MRCRNSRLHTRSQQTFTRFTQATYNITTSINLCIIIITQQTFTRFPQAAIRNDLVHKHFHSSSKVPYIRVPGLGTFHLPKEWWNSSRPIRLVRRLEKSLLDLSRHSGWRVSSDWACKLCIVVGSGLFEREIRFSVRHLKDRDTDKTSIKICTAGYITYLL